MPENKKTTKIWAISIHAAVFADLANALRHCSGRSQRLEQKRNGNGNDLLIMYMSSRNNDELCREEVLILLV